MIGAGGVSRRRRRRGWRRGDSSGGGVRRRLRAGEREQAVSHQVQVLHSCDGVDDRIRRDPDHAFEPLDGLIVLAPLVQGFRVREFPAGRGRQQLAPCVGEERRDSRRDLRLHRRVQRILLDDSAHRGARLALPADRQQTERAVLFRLDDRRRIAAVHARQRVERILVGGRGVELPNARHLRLPLRGRRGEDDQDHSTDQFANTHHFRRSTPTRVIPPDVTVTERRCSPNCG